jgi:periplasmic divalent cation tolerance protein
MLNFSFKISILPCLLDILYVKGLAMESNYYLTDEFSITLVTVPNLEEARKIAKTLVDERLAACVSIIPQIISTYRSEGEVAEYEEVQLLVKSRSSVFAKLTQRVKELHPATLPEIIEIAIQQMPDDYKMWLSDETM